MQQKQVLQWNSKQKNLYHFPFKNTGLSIINKHITNNGYLIK